MCQVYSWTFIAMKSSAVPWIKPMKHHGPCPACLSSTLSLNASLPLCRSPFPHYPLLLICPFHKTVGGGVKLGVGPSPIIRARLLLCSEVQPVSSADSLDLFSTETYTLMLPKSNDSSMTGTRWRGQGTWIACCQLLFGEEMSAL